ncbi:MAG: hypothetical protein CMG85_23590 [Marinobacter sp.]|nr:hypothetical protein [Marinobacter sp.]
MELVVFMLMEEMPLTLETMNLEIVTTFQVDFRHMTKLATHQQIILQLLTAFMLMLLVLLM